MAAARRVVPVRLARRAPHRAAAASATSRAAAAPTRAGGRRARTASSKFWRCSTKFQRRRLTRRWCTRSATRTAPLQYELAADARSAPKFAAFVAIAGLPHASNWPPLRPPPSLGLFGAADLFMPPTANLSLSGGDRSVSVDPTFGSRYAVARDVSTTWASAAGCDVAAAVPYALLAAPASAANRCTRWARGCHGGAEVVECVHAGGHEPPSWSVASAWSFFRRHKAHTDCHDTPGWTNGPRPGGALGCAEYAEKFCTGFGLAVGLAAAPPSTTRSGTASRVARSVGIRARSSERGGRRAANV